MFKKIAATLGTKVLITFINFLVVIITTNIMGAEIKGEVALLVLNITLAINFNNFVGGPALVFLASRIDPFRILVPAYTWSLMATGGFALLITVTGLSSAYQSWHVFFLSLIQALFNAHLFLLLGKNNVKLHNLLSLLQVLGLIATLSIMVFGLQQQDFEAYLIALYISFGLALLISVPLTYRYCPVVSLKGLGENIRSMVKYGAYSQIGGFAQILNYRLSFYILEQAPLGVSKVGIYSTGVQLSEAFWIISRSISMVQYAHISNTEDRAESRRLTIGLLKLSFLIVALMISVALLLPASFYTLIFGEEFSQVKSVMFYLAPGIAAFAVSGILSHYFAGVGLYRVNTISSSVGLVFTLALGFWLIPEYGIPGAGITASISYIASTIQQIVVFTREPGVHWKALIPDKNDWNFLISSLKKPISKG